MLTTLLLLASAASVEIIDRKGWGAREARSDISTYAEYGHPVATYGTIVLHVTSMGTGVGAAEAKRIQNFHMDVRGFSDIGYNFLIDSEGNVFEGRSLNNVPSHAGRSVEADRARDIRLDPDYGAIGIVFSADTTETLTLDQTAAAIELIRNISSTHPITSVITHTEVRRRLESQGLTPHNDYAPAACPGAGSIEQMIKIRSAVDPDFDPEAYRDIFN